VYARRVAARSKAIRPICILSTQRAGSTLLQRILGSHEEIGTASEPWFLLPLLYALRESGTVADYNQGSMAGGVRGFADEYLPRGVDSYLDAIHDLTLRLYTEATPGKRHFLDKSPRYHLIADDLLRLFPEGKFIFLFRQPLAVAASMIETWAEGKWNLDHYSADLFGLARLAETYDANKARAARVRYEDLLTQPIEAVRQLLDYLELPADETIVQRFVDLPMRNPRYWDPNTVRYQGISREPLDKWKTTMASPLRKTWCRRYLLWLGSERLEIMGYELDHLLAELDSIDVRLRQLPSDLRRASRGYVHRRVRSHILGVPLPLWRSREVTASAAAGGRNQ
jgi:Sulfotransferase family